MVIPEDTLARKRRAHYVARTRTITVMDALAVQGASLDFVEHPDRGDGVIEVIVERAIRTEAGELFRVEGSRYPRGNPGHVALDGRTYAPACRLLPLPTDRNADDTFGWDVRAVAVILDACRDSFRAYGHAIDEDVLEEVA